MYRMTAAAQLLLPMLVVMTGCGKGGGVGPQGHGDGLRAVLAAVREAGTQQFMVDAAAGASIVGAKGVHFIFPPAAFRTPAGGTVSGAVQVRVVEVLDIGDMVRLNTTTVGDDNGTLRVLKSGGAVHVSARQGNTDLVLGPQGMQIIVPTTAIDADMAVFTANNVAGGDLVWNEEAVASLDSTLIETQAGPIPGYVLQVDSLQWVNCDYFPWSPSNTFITAVTPSNLPDDSTLVWFAFPDMNAATWTYASVPHEYGFGTVPVGVQAVAIGLSRNGGVYSSAFTSFTTTAGGSVGLSFQPTTIQAFQAAVEAL